MMRRRVFVAIVVMGFGGLVAEILLLRELLIVFSGNELSIGIILANWLILEAFGCIYPGRLVERSKFKLEAFSFITILFSLSLPAAVFLTRILKSAIGVSIGESVGFFTIFYSSFLILLPVSLLHGALFTFSCNIYATYSRHDASSAGKVYVYETVGTIAAGIVCTYFLIPYLHAFQVAIGVLLLNVIVCMILLAPYWNTGVLQKTSLLLLGGFAFASVYAIHSGRVDAFHENSIKKQWRKQNVVHYQNSIYGNICIIENQGQYVFFVDGLPTIITPIPDIQFVEEFVHIPLLAHHDPRSILFLSGGAGGMINEALQHASIETIEYAELDPMLLSLLGAFPTPMTEAELNDDRVDVKHIDGRLLLKSTPNSYDLIFIGIMEPSNLQANRFFTKEFFTLAKERLNEGGILVLGAPGSMALLNDELKNLNSSIYHTLHRVFSGVRVIPGDSRNVFLSSNSEEAVNLEKTRMLQRVEQRSIAADIMLPWHIEKKLHHGWENWFDQFIEGSTGKVNRDFKPMGVFYSISYWNALVEPSFGKIYSQLEGVSIRTIVVLLVPFLVIYFLMRSRKRDFVRLAISFSIITTGFAGMIFSLIVIFAFQSVYGYVFSWIGLLVAAFMGGTAAGAMLLTRRLDRMENATTYFISIELAIICISALLPVVLVAVNEAWSSQGTLHVYKLLFLIISFICGMLVGSQFPLANKLYLASSSNLSRTAGLLYASDLLGGWLGGVIGAIVLLPILGLTGTCITVVMLKVASLVVMATQPKEQITI